MPQRECMMPENSKEAGARRGAGDGRGRGRAQWGRTWQPVWGSGCHMPVVDVGSDEEEQLEATGTVQVRDHDDLAQGGSDTTSEMYLDSK